MLNAISYMTMISTIAFRYTSYLTTMINYV